MTLSVESLNKLYFQFIETHLQPHLDKALPEVSQLLRCKSAYEVHRFLEDLLMGPSVEHYSSRDNSSLNDSLSSLSSPYQYALPTAAEPAKGRQDSSHPFNKSAEKRSDETKPPAHKMNMRKALTGLAYDDRSKPQLEDKLPSVPNTNNDLMQSLGNSPTDFKVADFGS
jgi:hypothetical protein